MNMTRNPTSGASHVVLPCGFSNSVVLQELQRKRRGYIAVSSAPGHTHAFTDGAAAEYYAGCGKKQQKRTHKAIKLQRDRLRELAGRFEADGATGDLGLLATVVTEMRELSENLVQVSEVPSPPPLHPTTQPHPH